MSCPSWQDKIALYVGGDVAADEIGALNEHLHACAACGSFASALERDGGLLRAAPPEMSGVDFGAMRAAMIEQISARWDQEVRWKWRALIPAAAAILLVIAVGSMRTVSRSASQGASLSARVAVSVPRPAGARALQGNTRHSETDRFAALYARIAPKGRQPNIGSSSPVAMRLSTGDPSVVIIWVQEMKAGGDE